LDKRAVVRRCILKRAVAATATTAAAAVVVERYGDVCWLAPAMDTGDDNVDGGACKLPTFFSPYTT